jgi:uncharacterized cofD-like protein
MLTAKIRLPATGKMIRVEGESAITNAGGVIERVFLEPGWAHALPAVMHALLTADLILIGPGSLYTSILPNLLVGGVADSIRSSRALKVYVCNIATQPGETVNYNVADHIAALEEHVGSGLFEVVIANNHYPLENAGPNTIYVQPAPSEHPVYQRYRLVYADLTDDERPWRHSPDKLRQVLMNLESTTQAVKQPEFEVKVAGLR